MIALVSCARLDANDSRRELWTSSTSIIARCSSRSSRYESNCKEGCDFTHLVLEQRKHGKFDAAMRARERSWSARATGSPDACNTEYQSQIRDSQGIKHSKREGSHQAAAIHVGGALIHPHNFMSGRSCAQDGGVALQVPH